MKNKQKNGEENEKRDWIKNMRRKKDHERRKKRKKKRGK